MYKLAYTSEARSQILSFQKKIRLQIKSALERLAGQPALGKQLTGDLGAFWSYRTGDYRIIYQTHHKELMVLIIAVGNRKDIYKHLP